MEILIITGMSGSGKSKALNALEDIGFYCIDNLPLEFLNNLVITMQQSEYVYKKVAVLMDSRGNLVVQDLIRNCEELKEMGVNYKILFLDASDDVLLKRYKETRRIHPLMLINNKLNLNSAIELERKKFKNIKDIADYVIDTSLLSTSQFKEKIVNYFDEEKERGLLLNFVSFGFKNGILADADLIFDVRCLPNPFYVPELREKTGLNKEVRNYVMNNDHAKDLFDSILNYLKVSLPLYEKEGKSQLVVGLGCTGGKHRSVTFTKLLNEYFKKEYNCVESHRDIDRK